MPGFGYDPPLDGVMRVVVYDFDLDAYPARPGGATVVRWIGPSEPPNWTDYDEWREVAAPPTVPGAPTSVTGVAGDAQVELSWLAPVDNGGSAITGYTITPYIGATAQTPVSVGNVTSYTVTGLTNDTEYTFVVAATNAVGTGAESTASTGITPVAGPSIALVQNKAGGSATTAGSRALTFDTAPTQGNLLVAYIVTTSQNVTISNSNGWTQAGVESYGSANQGRVAIWYKVAGASESSTVTLSFSISAPTSGMVIEEWSGCATTSPLDVTDTTGSGAATNATTLTLGPTSAVSQADVLAVAVYGFALDMTFGNTWTNSFTQRATSTGARYTVGYLVGNTPSATYSTAETWTPNTVCAGVLAVFKGA